MTNRKEKIEKEDFWQEYRCNLCSKLLGKHYFHKASLEIKCERCGKLNSIFEDNERQIFITDNRGIILYVNSQVEKVSGYPIQEVLGKTPAIWGKQMPAIFYKKLWKAILLDKRAIVEKVTNRKKNGELYEAIIRISPILNDQGDVQFFLGVQTPVIN